MGLRAWILESEKEVRPLSDVMSDKYQTLTDWLHRFDLTSEEVKETFPGLYVDIQDAIERLDSAFYKEDLPAFQDSLERIKTLYTEAIYAGEELKNGK
jgi:hypothetical protein